MDDTARESKRQRGLQLNDDEVFLYEGRGIARRREITRVRIGPQVESIPRDIFEGCSNLAEVQFDEGLKYIEFGAFSQCTALQKVNLPSSVINLFGFAFNGCINLAEAKLNVGLKVIGESAFRGCEALQLVTIPLSVTKVGKCAFRACANLAEVQFDEGAWLRVIEEDAFYQCEALRSLAIPSRVKTLRNGAFWRCINLAEVRFNEGLEVIGDSAFHHCKALRSVAIPSSVTKVGRRAFANCTNLTEVILLGGGRLSSKGFLDRGRFSEGGAGLHNTLNGMIFSSGVHLFAFAGCPLTNMKISTPSSLTERMTRLPEECRLSIERRIRDLHRLELTQDGDVLACFPVVRTPGYIYGHNVQDTNNQTAESLHKVLQLIFYHELKEYRTLIELAMWKSRLDGDRARSDCRISIPDPAKSLIMEYCGFTPACLSDPHHYRRGLQ